MWSWVRALTLLLAALAGARALLDCRAACARCRRPGDHHPALLEVYCAMCAECAAKRQGGGGAGGGEQDIYEIDTYPEECPTPPPCAPDASDWTPHTLRVPSTRTTTTTAAVTTTTTTRKPCPPVVGCKRRPRPSPLPPVCYYPCLPACPCPYPYPPAPGSHPSARPPPPVATADVDPGYLYVYVGVPKQMQLGSHRPQQARNE